MLLIYKKTDDVYEEISYSSDLTNPVSTVHDGRDGGSTSLQLYLRNDDAAKWYSNVTIQPIDLVDANPYGDIGYTETGWGVKLSAGSEEPTVGEWEDTSWGNLVEMADVGSADEANTATYYSFWYYITCPPCTLAQVKTDIVLRTSYTENSVD